MYIHSFFLFPQDIARLQSLCGCNSEHISLLETNLNILISGQNFDMKIQAETEEYAKFCESVIQELYSKTITSNKKIYELQLKDIYDTIHTMVDRRRHSLEVESAKQRKLQQENKTATKKVEKAQNTIIKATDLSVDNTTTTDKAEKISKLDLQQAILAKIQAKAEQAKKLAQKPVETAKSTTSVTPANQDSSNSTVASQSVETQSVETQSEVANSVSLANQITTNNLVNTPNKSEPKIELKFDAKTESKFEAKTTPVATDNNRLENRVSPLDNLPDTVPTIHKRSPRDYEPDEPVKLDTETQQNIFKDYENLFNVDGVEIALDTLPEEKKEALSNIDLFALEQTLYGNQETNHTASAEQLEHLAHLVDLSKNDAYDNDHVQAYNQAYGSTNASQDQQVNAKLSSDDVLAHISNEEFIKSSLGDLLGLSHHDLHTTSNYQEQASNLDYNYQDYNQANEHQDYDDDYDDNDQEELSTSSNSSLRGKLEHLGVPLIMEFSQDLYTRFKFAVDLAYTEALYSGLSPEEAKTQTEEYASQMQLRLREEIAHPEQFESQDSILYNLENLDLEEIDNYYKPVEKLDYAAYSNQGFGTGEVVEDEYDQDYDNYDNHQSDDSYSNANSANLDDHIVISDPNFDEDREEPTLAQQQYAEGTISTVEVPIFLDLDDDLYARLEYFVNVIFSNFIMQGDDLEEASAKTEEFAVMAQNRLSHELEHPQDCTSENSILGMLKQLDLSEVNDACTNDEDEIDQTYELGHRRAIVTQQQHGRSCPGSGHSCGCSHGHSNEHNHDYSSDTNNYADSDTEQDINVDVLSDLINQYDNINADLVNKQAEFERQSHIKNLDEDTTDFSKHFSAAEESQQVFGEQFSEDQLLDILGNLTKSGALDDVLAGLVQNFDYKAAREQLANENKVESSAISSVNLTDHKNSQTQASHQANQVNQVNQSNSDSLKEDMVSKLQTGQLTLEELLNSDLDSLVDLLSDEDEQGSLNNRQAANNQEDSDDYYEQEDLSSDEEYEEADFDNLSLSQREQQEETLCHNGKFLDILNGTVRPKNINQDIYCRAILDRDITFGVGPAGTGKTYLAVAIACEYLMNNKVKRIILTRPAVEAGEKLGFLPGDLNQKLDPYLKPLFDALYDIIGGVRLNKLMESNIIEIAPLAYMRGRTLADAFIILDEAQNTTTEQMKMFLTRLGYGSKMVITGDVSQIDLPNNKKSGLIHAQEVLKNIPAIRVHNFNANDIVRHPTSTAVVRAYEAWDSLHPTEEKPAHQKRKVSFAEMLKALQK